MTAGASVFTLLSCGSIGLFGLDRQSRTVFPDATPRDSVAAGGMPLIHAALALRPVAP